jgi:hypothetical protein
MNLNHETFSPESNNSRLRRAFAHTMIAQVAEGIDVLPEAQIAVEATGTSLKSLESGFDAALVNANETGRPLLIAAKSAAFNRNQVGLPETATDEELAEAKEARSARIDRRYVGLPEDATDEELVGAREARSARIDRRYVGLPEDATDEELVGAREARSARIDRRIKV